MMAMMRWDPFGEVLRMQRDMDRIYSRMGLGEGRQGEGQSETWMPKIDIRQRGDDITVHAELPGMKPEDVDIEFTDGVLTISGHRQMQEEKEEEGWLVRESSYGSFQRSIAVPENVDPSSISADYRDGILEITVPKALEETKPKTTKIGIGQGGKAALGESEGEQKASQEQGQTTSPRSQEGEKVSEDRESETQSAESSREMANR
jgi:HSP20 family protein